MKVTRHEAHRLRFDGKERRCPRGLRRAAGITTRILGAPVALLLAGSAIAHPGSADLSGAVGQNPQLASGAERSLFQSPTLIVGLAALLCVLASVYLGWRAAQALRSARESVRWLHSLVNITPGPGEEEVFGRLARGLAFALGCRWATVSRILESGARVRTLGLWDKDHLASPLEYDLPGSPCEQALQAGLRVFHEDVAHLFPQDDLLQELGVVGYVGQPLRDPSGRLIGILNAFHDAPLSIGPAELALFGAYARRAEAELSRLLVVEKLTASELTQRTVLGSLPDGVMTIDSEGTILAANPAAEQIYGWPPGSFVGDSVAATMCEEDRDRQMEDIRGLIAKAERGPVRAKTEDARGRRRDGATFPLDASAAAYTLDGKGVLTLIIRDVSERSMMEHKLRRLAQAAESAADVIVMTDSAGTITWVNPAFTAVTGYPREEALGQTPRLLKSGVQPPEFYEKLWGEIASGRSWSGQIKNKKKDGSLYDASLTIAPICSEGGQIDGFVAVQRDVTAVVEKERDLLRLKEELTEKASLLEAQNRDLAAAREAAVAGDRAKSEFLANMSHEIRTPMNGVLGFVDLLLDTELTRQQREYLETVRVSGETLLTVINEILDFSKIEAGKLDLETIPFDLRELIEGVGDLLAPRAQEKGLELVCAVSPGSPSMLSGDPVRLRQVLTNLAGNAIKFTRQGEITVSVETVARGNRRLDAVFRVSDTGIGIAPEKLDGLFQPFTQVDGSTTRLYGGTGLGLAISRRLVEMMGGRIEVESAMDEGSTFTATIPMDRADAADGTQTPGAGALTGLRVLVVDDNETNCDLLFAMLSSFDCRPTSVKGGWEAIGMLREAAASRNPFRLALLDRQMPGINGIDLARRIRSEKGLGGLPLILLSSMRICGNEEGEDLFAAVLSKPVKQLALLDAILNTLSPRIDDLAPAAVHAGSDPGGAEALPEAEPRSEPLRILLVEDNPVNQKVAVALLAREGHQVEVAADGREAFDRVMQADYDIIFMDVQMPVMDGYEATAAIRTWEYGRCHVPIIAMTARAMKGDRERCLQAGMDDHLTKPIRSKELSKIIQKWSSEAPAHEEWTEARPLLNAEPHREHMPREIEEKAPPETGEESCPAQSTSHDSDGRQEMIDRLSDLGLLDDPEMLSETLRAFLLDTEASLCNLAEAVDSGDAHGVERAAHRIRGACLNLGASALGQLSETLEAKGRDQELEGSSGILMEMREAFGRLKGLVEDLLRQARAA
ncbi:MAG: response regulator [Candidatus Eisenbacteria bacterium]|nr:response regulator [Candidatus Eisenbacteria bacterium]